MRWLCSTDTRMVHSLHLVTSELAREELEAAIQNKIEASEITAQQARGIMLRARPYLKTFFHPRPIDGKDQLGYDRAQLLSELRRISGLFRKKDSQDLLHLATIVNNLRFLGGASTPHLITADCRFAEAVPRLGYPAINVLEWSAPRLDQYFVHLERNGMPNQKVELTGVPRRFIER